jgi:hypothetical protein
MATSSRGGMLEAVSKSGKTLSAVWLLNTPVEVYEMVIISGALKLRNCILMCAIFCYNRVAPSRLPR